MLAGVIAGVLAVYTVLAAIGLGSVQAQPGWVRASSGPAPAINLLLIGTDDTPAAVGRADTLVLVNLPADGSGVYLVSIARELLVTFDGYAMPLKQTRPYGGVPRIVQGVEQITGVPIDHAIETDFQGFAALTDLVGGVTVTNPQASNDGGNVMPQGSLTLQGDQALAYVRDHSVSDAVRAERQRSVLSAVLAKLPGAMANPVALARVAVDLNHVSVDDSLLRRLPQVLAPLARGVDRVVGIPLPLLPQVNHWDRPRVDKTRTEVLARALREGTMATYQPRRP